MPSFIWDDHNEDHIARHNISPREAEYVVRHASWPYPEEHGDDKWLVRGQTEGGYYIQVIFVLAADAKGMDFWNVDLSAATDPEAVYVIHARPLKPSEIRVLRRRRR